MSRIKKLTGLEKARAIKHQRYVAKELQRLQRKFIPTDNKQTIKQSEIYNRIRGASDFEGISFRQAVKGIEATRAFTSEEQNFKIQINRKLSLSARNQIRAAIAAKTGKAYKEISLNILDGNWTYNSTSQAITDSANSVSITLTRHKTGESAYDDFVEWQLL